MIDKPCAVKTSEGARKKRQREINRDETRTSAGSHTDEAEKSDIYSGRAHERIALEANRAARGLMGSR